MKFINFQDILNNPAILDDIDVLINVGDGDTAHTGGSWWSNPVISATVKKFVYEGGGINNPAILDDIDVLINVGDGDTAHTGGSWWSNPVISATVKKFVYEGGGIIGIGEPTGHQENGRYIQLANVFGVEKETGFTLGYDKYNWECAEHFITKDQTEDIDFGENQKNIYALEGTQVLVQKDHRVNLAVHEFGKGRAVYMSGLPYSFANNRLLYRSILWSTHDEENLLRWYSTNYNVEVHAGRAVYMSGLPYSFANNRLLYRSILWSTHDEENLLRWYSTNYNVEVHAYVENGKYCVVNTHDEENLLRWYSTNYNVEVHAYVENGKYCVVNNTYEPQETTIYRGDGSSFDLQMKANEIIWYEI